MRPLGKLLAAIPVKAMHATDITIACEDFPYLGHHAPIYAKVSYGLIDDFHTSCLADNVDIDQVWLVNTSNIKRVLIDKKKEKQIVTMFTITEMVKEMYLL